VHLLITTIASTAAAGSINEDFSTYLIRCWIKVDRTMLHVEYSVHRMENIAQGKIDHCFLLRVFAETKFKSISCSCAWARAVTISQRIAVVETLK
jgi:hypothetical protein